MAAQLVWQLKRAKEKCGRQTLTIVRHFSNAGCPTNERMRMSGNGMSSVHWAKVKY